MEFESSAFRVFHYEYTVVRYNGEHWFGPSPDRQEAYRLFDSMLGASLYRRWVFTIRPRNMKLYDAKPPWSPDEQKEKDSKQEP